MLSTPHAAPSAPPHCLDLSVYLAARSRRLCDVIVWRKRARTCRLSRHGTCATRLDRRRRTDVETMFSGALSRRRPLPTMSVPADRCPDIKSPARDSVGSQGHCVPASHSKVTGHGKLAGRRADAAQRRAEQDPPRWPADWKNGNSRWPAATRTATTPTAYASIGRPTVRRIDSPPQTM